MLLATHEMGFAREVASKVCFLDEGVVCEEGRPSGSSPTRRTTGPGTSSSASSRPGACRAVTGTAARYRDRVAALTLPASWYVDPSYWGRERRAVFGRSGCSPATAEALPSRATTWPATSPGGRWWSWSTTRGCSAPTTTCAGTGPGPRPRRSWPGAEPGVPLPRLGLRARRPAPLGATSGRPTGGTPPGWPFRGPPWRTGGPGVRQPRPRRPRPPLLEALGTFADQCEPYPMEDLVPDARGRARAGLQLEGLRGQLPRGLPHPARAPRPQQEIDARRYVVDVDERHRWVRHSAPARDGAVNAGRWLWRWPNLALNLYPGGMNVERYDPVAPDRTRCATRTPSSGPTTTRRARPSSCRPR